MAAGVGHVMVGVVCTAPVAAPFSAIVCVAPRLTLLSLITSEPLMLPPVVGVKLMGNVQLVFAGTEADDPEELVSSGQAVPPTLFRVKPVEMLGLVPVPGMGNVSAALPMFSSVTVCGLSLLVEPTAVDANVSDGALLMVSFTTFLLAASAM